MVLCIVQTHNNICSYYTHMNMHIHTCDCRYNKKMELWIIKKIAFLFTLTHILPMLYIGSTLYVCTMHII